MYYIIHQKKIQNLKQCKQSSCEFQMNRDKVKIVLVYHLLFSVNGLDTGSLISTTQSWKNSIAN